MDKKPRVDSSAEILLDTNIIGSLIPDSEIDQHGLSSKKFSSKWQEEKESAKSEATFRFVATDISKMKETVLSPPTYVRNLPWRVMLMPRASQTQSRVITKGLGVFLQCNADSESTTWSCNAIAELKIISHKNPKETFTRTIQHVYNSKENDWGFSHFISWSDLMDPQRNFIKDDMVIFEAWVSADAPHGMSWDSKRHTGFVGLKNQGATCYMNSLLQTLFFTNQLRNAVYHIPTECEETFSSVPLALQRVFYELQFSEHPVGTKKLTKSFGWDTFESFMQHDVQELCRVLLDNMESKMKGTCVEGTIPQLYEGKTISFIRCKDVDYSSTRVETYYDIQLNVKGNKDIYHSFADYCEIETLDGDNKYDADEYGLQDAEKGIIFDSFPPVLHLHLLRFQYDPITDSNIKINDRYEFPEKLDLDEFLKEPEATPATYTLHAVLVHSGDNHGGHYVVFINPIESDGEEVDWCKFDDDVVACCSKQDAIDYNFGGEDDDIVVRHTTNAYMLVYVRDSAISQVLQTVGEEAIPEQLKERFDEERRVEILKKKERQEAYLYMNIHVILEDNFYGHQGNDLYDPEKTYFLTFKIKKSYKVEEALAMLSEQMRYPIPMLRIWPFGRRGNSTFRPRNLYNDELKKEVLQITDASSSLTIFLERLQPDSDINSLPEFDSETQVLLFFKYYEPHTRAIFYCGHAYVLKFFTVRDLIPIANEKAGLSPSTILYFYEEVKPNMITQFNDLDLTLEKSFEELMSGDIIVFQRADLDLENYVLPTAPDYFRDLFYRVEVTFCDMTKPDDTGFVLEMSLKLNYDQMAKMVGQRLGVDPYSIQFYRSQAYKDQPGIPLRYTFEGTLKEVLGLMKMRSFKKVYYKLLTIRVDQLENRRQLKLLWMNNQMRIDTDIVVYPNKNGKVRDVLEEVLKQVKLPDGGSGRLRLLEVTNSRIIECFLEEQPVDMLINIGNNLFRAEEIPLDEVELADDELLVPVNHFHGDLYSTFGVPFFLKVKHGEPLENIKERIKGKLDLPEKELEKFRFAFVHIRVQYFEDEEEEFLDLYNLFPQANISARPWIGLEHPNKLSKKYQGYQYHEKAIKIHN